MGQLKGYSLEPVKIIPRKNALQKVFQFEHLFQISLTIYDVIKHLTSSLAQEDYKPFTA